MATVRRMKKGDDELRPVRANAGIKAAYNAKLRDLIDEMHDSLEYWLKTSYRAEMAQDKSPADVLQDRIAKLRRQWDKNFSEKADKIATWFAKKVLKYSDASFSMSLADKDYAVKFGMTTEIQDQLDAIVHENVSLIKSISEHHLTQVEGVVMRSVQQGRDLSDLSKSLTEQFGVTKRRAALISRDQNNKATASINRSRQQELGITQARWRHSHAGKVPRPSHVAANGKVFDIEKGMYIDGEWIMPGQKINCRCTSAPIIKGFNAS